MSLKAGKYKAINTGFLFDRLQAKGNIVVISQSFLDEHKRKTGKDFAASWLSLIEQLHVDPPKEDEQVLREKEESVLRDRLDSLGIEVDGRWGIKKLQEQLDIAEQMADK